MGQEAWLRVIIFRDRRRTKMISGFEGAENYLPLQLGEISDRDSLHSILWHIKDAVKRGPKPFVIVLEPKDKAIIMQTVEKEVERLETLRVLEAALILTDLQFGGTEYNKK
jgi:hypothetical protein